MRLLSCGSYACELLFAKIRTESNYNNTLDKAFYVIADYIVSNYIKSEIDVDVEPNRLAENKTKSVCGGVKLTN